MTCTNNLDGQDTERSRQRGSPKENSPYATAYGGTVISWAWRSLYPRPAVIEGVKYETELKGVDTAK